MSYKHYLEGKDLIKVALRSPEIIFDAYDEMPKTKELRKAYQIASQSIKHDEDRYDR